MKSQQLPSLPCCPLNKCPGTQDHYHWAPLQPCSHSHAVSTSAHSLYPAVSHSTSETEYYNKEVELIFLQILEDIFYQIEQRKHQREGEGERVKGATLSFSRSLQDRMGGAGVL